VRALILSTYLRHWSAKAMAATVLPTSMIIRVPLAMDESRKVESRRIWNGGLVIWRQNRRAAFGSSESSSLAVIVPASQRETGHRKEFELLAAVWTDLVRPAALWLWHHAREDLEQNFHPDAISLGLPSSRIQFAGRTTSRHCYRAALAPTSSHRCC
jgi:hypothetical protein